MRVTDKHETTVHGGENVIGLLGVAFVVLKLTGFIDWSWWWVTLPFWGGAALALTIVAVWLLVIAIIATWQTWRDARNKKRRHR